MNAAMTPEEYSRFAQAAGQRVMDFFDGFALVGFHPTTGEPVIFTHAADFKTRVALSSLLQIALANNVVVNSKPPAENGNNQAGS